MKKQKRPVLRLVLSAFVVFLLFSCGEDVSTPKPRAYPKVIYPERGYQTFESPACPFRFDFPAYSNIKKDEKFFDAPVENDCWMDIQLEPFNGSLHISFKEINKENTLPQLVEDMYRLTSKHVVKADFIEDFAIQTDKEVGGMLFDVGGDTASAIQFFLTDSTSNFVRGALYFNTTPNADSLAPIVEFVRQDLNYLIDSFEWKEI